MTSTQIFPNLSTRNIARLVPFYTTAVDAVVTYQFPAEGEAGFLSLDLAGGHIGIGLDPTAPAPGAAQRTALWIYTDNHDDAYRRLIEAGAKVVDQPADMPWGERVATVTDPDGNVVHLGQHPSNNDQPAPTSRPTQRRTPTPSRIDCAPEG